MTQINFSEVRPHFAILDITIMSPEIKNERVKATVTILPLHGFRTLAEMPKNERLFCQKVEVDIALEKTPTERTLV